MEYKLDNKINIWWHGINDNKWGVDSYKNVIEIQNMTEYHECLSHLTNTILPNSMIFIMKNGIDPVWEHPDNVNGGCWSFKISKGQIHKYWTELSIYLLGENLVSKDVKLINGLSISPKKSFCIMKIWNNDKKINDKQILNKSMDIPFDSCIYKQHK